MACPAGHPRFSASSFRRLLKAAENSTNGFAGQGIRKLLAGSGYIQLQRGCKLRYSWTKYSHDEESASAT